MPQSASASKITRALAAAGLLALTAPGAFADETSASAGVLKNPACSKGQAQVLPLPATHIATVRKDWTATNVTNLATNETFKMPFFPHYPVSAGAQPIPLANIDNDGQTFIMPVDLTGRGVSDLVIARKGWGGWEVFTNGACLSKPFDGFVEGLYTRDKEQLQAKLIAVDTQDLQVDNNLLAAVGDFLGNGTEQVAYFRPGWNAIAVVGAHGRTQMPAELAGIAADKEGDRQHFLFAFKGGKPGERTRLAYYRKGHAKLAVFTSDGARFTRSEADTKASWNQLNQNYPNPL